MPDKTRPLLLKLNIPFCSHKCSYCPLPVCAYNAGTVRAHGEAMLAEIRAAAEDAQGSTVQAISIEGGSPCLTPPDLLRDMLRTIRKHYLLAEDVHLGLQTMPGDYSRAMVQRMADEGVNFWTVGLQTADAEEHRLLGRPYRFDALTMVDTAVKVFPMRALNFELLYGIPGQTMHTWRHSLDAALAYEPEHLSLHPLLLLPATPLLARCRSGEVSPCTQEAKIEFYTYAKERLESLGYRGYTVSDFARPGHEDRYRLGLLDGAEYLGFGYQAESCLDGIRYSNGHSLPEYLEHSTDPSVIANHVTGMAGAGEALSYTVSRLVRDAGLEEQELAARFGAGAKFLLEDFLPKLIGQKWLEKRSDSRLSLTAAGIVSGALYQLR